MILNCDPLRQEFRERIASARELLEATHALSGTIDASRQARGLAILLLYAAYERLLHALCRALLEAARSLRVGNRRLRPGLQLFAAFSDLQSANAVSPPRLWQGMGQAVIRTLSERRDCTINVDLFPNDGSHMRQQQVRTICQLFDLGDPGTILKEVWNGLDAVVSRRNDIAHGQLTPEEVGRDYTIADIKTLVDNWEQRWLEFLDYAENRASVRDFYRTAR